MRIPSLVFASLLAVWLAGQTVAVADGCFVPQQGIARLPEIPAQRAIVAYRDGRETLIVESSLDGQGSKFGWVIPVPSRPDRIAAASPGAIRSMAMGVQPHVVLHLDGGLMFLTALVCASILLCALTWGVLRRLGVSSGACDKSAVVALFILPALALTMRIVSDHAGEPAPKTAKAAGPELPSGVTVLERSRAGSYDIAVLAADDASALYKWLEAEGLAIPAELRPAVDDYASRGWRFVTARMVTDGGGQAVPHPLQLSFKSAEAVYPMRLTGLSGRDLDLELYVIAGQAASAPGMKRVFCDEFVPGRGTPWFASPLRFYFTGGTAGVFFQGRYSDLALGHPGVVPVMWNGCWVSKLKGKLAAGDLQEDLALSWNEPGFEQQTVYSSMAAGQAAAIACAILFTVAAAALLPLWGLRRLRWRWALLSVTGLAAALYLVFAAVMALLPQMPTARVGGKVDYRMHEMGAVLSNYDRNDRFVPAEVARSVRERSRDWLNPFTGEPIREEDSPGNFTLEVGRDEVRFTFYDLGGTPVIVTAPRPEAGPPRSDL